MFQNGDNMRSFIMSNNDTPPLQLLVNPRPDPETGEFNRVQETENPNNREQNIELSLMRPSRPQFPRSPSVGREVSDELVLHAEDPHSIDSNVILANSRNQSSEMTVFPVSGRSELMRFDEDEVIDEFQDPSEEALIRQTIFLRNLQQNHTRRGRRFDQMFEVTRGQQLTMSNPETNTCRSPKAETSRSVDQGESEE